MSDIRVVTALIDTKISAAEIPYLRGSVIRFSEGNLLCHNHQDGNFRYAYPLVQYKRTNGRATLQGINQGAETLMALLAKVDSGLTLQLGNRTAEIGFIDIRSETFPLECLPEGESLTYSLSHWLPLNSENYLAFQQNESLTDRIALLESILVGNILTFAQGVGVYFDQQVICRLLELSSDGLVSYKGVRLMAFSATFCCNVRLPELIGLGKAVSMGYGIVRKQ